MVASVIGKSRLVYDLTGQATRLAHALQASASIGTINVSEEIHEILDRLYDFQQEPPLDLADGVQHQVWKLESFEVVKHAELPA